MSSPPLPLIPWAKTSLLSSRKSLESLLIVQRTALDLFVLGYSSQANKLVDALYEHSYGIEFDLQEWNTMRALYDAWDATNTTPHYISNPNLDMIFNGKGSESESQWRWKEWDKYWVEGLPEIMRERALKKKLVKDDVDEALKRLSVDPESAEKTMTIGAVVQVAMLAGEQQIAQDLVQKHVRDLYLHLQEHWRDGDGEEKDLRKQIQSHLGLQYSPQIWTLLTKNPLGPSLRIPNEAVDAFVTEGCTQIAQRFTHGPSRPYATTSIPELLRIMDESYIAARTANPRAGVHMSIIGSDVPSTFLVPGATDEAISELEDRLSSMAALDDEDEERIMLPGGCLPEDYKEFLRTSDGFQVEPGDSTGIFCGVEEVGMDDVAHMHDMEYTLFPYEYTSVSGIDNIDLGEFSCFTIGSGGDEGQVILIPPSSVEPVLERFEEVYASASERHKKMYERAAVDLYGGLEKMREVEWLVVVFYHWDPDQQIWGSFREYLEYCVGYAVRRKGDDEKKAGREVDEGEESG